MGSSSTAARPPRRGTYVEADRSRVDDYYLAEGTGRRDPVRRLDRRRAGDRPSAGRPGRDAYERWVAGYDVETGAPKGRLRTDDAGAAVRRGRGQRAEDLVAGRGAAPGDRRRLRRRPGPGGAVEIIGWLAEHATTRVGPRGRQVQVPVEQLEAAVVRHYTSRAGDPHRHLHLQINARVFAAGAWRGLHSVGRGGQHRGDQRDRPRRGDVRPRVPRPRSPPRLHPRPETGEVAQLAPYAGAFSAAAAQIGRNIDRYEAEWRGEHPGAGARPAAAAGLGPARLGRGPARQGRPRRRRRAGGTLGRGAARARVHPPPDRVPAAACRRRRSGALNRDAVAELVLSRLGARRSAWNAADIRGEVERIIAAVDVVAAPAVRGELAEDLTARTVGACVPLLDRDDVPEHVRALTSPRVLEVEADLVPRLAARAEHPPRRPGGPVVAGRQLDHAQRAVVAALAGSGTCW